MNLEKEVNNNCTGTSEGTCFTLNATCLHFHWWIFPEEILFINILFLFLVVIYVF